MIQVKTFFAYNELRNFSYLIFDDMTGEAWIVDPYDADPLINHIKKNSLSLMGILNTHKHFDHKRGNRPLQEAFESPIRKLQNAEKLKLNENYELEGLDTPGHTSDHKAFILNSRDRHLALFSGDTLFNAGVGNCRDGNVDQMYESTMMIMEKLPEETKLYPGHDYIARNLEFAKSLEPSNPNIASYLAKVKEQEVEQREPETLGAEKLFNPFLRLSSKEIQENFKKDIKQLEDEEQFKRDLFHKIRALRDNW